MPDPSPISAEQAFSLAIAHFAAGRLAEADAMARSILQADPRHIRSIRLLAQLARVAGQPETALTIIREALRVAPDSAEINHEMGVILFSLNRAEESIAAHRRALVLDPDFAQCLSDLGELEFHCGRPELAAPLLERAMLLRPGDSEIHARYVRAIRFQAEQYPGMVFEQHKVWGRKYAEPLQEEIHPHTNDRSPERPLRVGYVSSDLFSHPVASFLENILTTHDSARIHVHVYADMRIQDAKTARLRALVPQWRDITGRPDDQVAAMIREDGIDILVDLAGHSQSNRLCLFARKPAPVQATYLGYPDTTGVPAIDYRITDAVADPPGEADRYHTEKLLRLPAPFLCYRVPDASSEWTPPPATTGAPITFGTFNIISKLNPQIIALWARIMQQIPGSRLVLKGWVLGDAGAANLVAAAFAAHGIPAERLILLPFIPDPALHLERYREIDIALDTFPYHGTTTTCEALWMGVPVVTLAGKTHAARVGVSLLNAVGRPEWIAEDADQYVALAVGLARDIPALAKIRRELRDQMRASPLMDAGRFVRGLENAYREIWRKWCASA